jgi:hypothetical protein
MVRSERVTEHQVVYIQFSWLCIYRRDAGFLMRPPCSRSWSLPARTASLLMLERDVASDFNKIFAAYPILAPINNAIGGWPDRLIQLEDSRVVAVEIKRIELFKNGLEFRLSTFRKEQGAWLAKWQRNEGLCFLFLGLTDLREDLQGYGIITVSDWRRWIELVNAVCNVRDYLTLYTKDWTEIIDWFVTYTERVDA